MQDQKTIWTLGIILAMGCTWQTPIAWAQELPENFNPVRPLGMGNAFTAVANDESAIWTNPAGIARARKARARDFFTVKVPNIGVGANRQGRALLQAKQGSGTMASIVTKNANLGMNKPYWTHAQIFPVAMFDYNRNLPGAFGLYSHSVSKMLVEADTPEQTQINLVSDAGVVSNLTYTSDSNRFSFGVQARYTMRYAYEETVATAEIGDNATMLDKVKEGANQSSAVGLDIGGLYTIADFWFPTLGFSILNLPTGCKSDYLNPHSELRQSVCGTVYSGTIPNEDALSTVDPTDIRLGMAITPRLTRSLSLRVGLDAHHIYVPVGEQGFGLDGIEVQKMLHAGVELFFGNPLDQAPLAFRAGVNQGFITSGFGFNIAHVNLDFATYGTDVSSSSKKVEDRRYVGSLSLNF